MTTPHGYQDYGRFAAQADIMYYDRQVYNLLANTSVMLPALSVFGTRSIMVNAWSGSNRFLMQLHWCYDQAGSNLVNTDNYVCPASGEIPLMVPTRSPYLIIELWAPFALPVLITLTVAGSASPGKLQGGECANVLMSRSSFAVNAGASDVVRPTVLMPGWATLQVGSGIATWLFYLDCEDVNGGITTFARVDSSAPFAIHRIILPTGCVKCTFFNTSAANGTYSAFLNSVPISGDF